MAAFGKLQQLFNRKLDAIRRRMLWRTMSSRSKEKVAAAFRRLFRSSQKMGGEEGACGGQQGCSSGGGGGSGGGGVGGAATSSPARRLLSRHGYHRDSVKPSDSASGLDSPDRSPGAAAAAAAASRKTVADLFRRKGGGGSSGGAGGPGGSCGGGKSGAGCSRRDEAPPPAPPTPQAPPTMATATATASSVRCRRLMKELREIQRSQQLRSGHDHDHDPVFTVELVNDNLFEWHVRLHRVDADSELATDMKDLGVPFILLHLVFPDNFPFAPPFMRVISPRIEKGFVMEGGAICMELLTPRGWASAYTVEAIVMQFAASIVKGQGRIARKHKGSKDFNRRSAEEAFRSLVKTHEKYGWVTPPLADG